MEDQQKELEEQREMAANRLAELDRLHQNHRDVLQQLEHLKMDVCSVLKQIQSNCNMNNPFFPNEDPSTSGICGRRDDRVQVPAVAVLCFV